jgi:hypothetical protein
MERGKSKGKGRDSAPKLYNAIVTAKNALKEGISAWDQHQKGNLEESKRLAERARQYLTERCIYYFRSFGSGC